MPGNLSLVWLKRDLRTRDHRPLLEAAAHGSVVPIFVFEPTIWCAGEMDGTHFQFVCESLLELDQRFRERGTRLAIRVGELPYVFAEIAKKYSIQQLFSHEETGTLRTYARDKRVARWCRDMGIFWNEYSQNGVIRRLANRDGWASNWTKTMNRDLLTDTPSFTTVREFDWGAIPSPEQVGLDSVSAKCRVQVGGENNAHKTLDSFLGVRVRTYRTAMSSPITAETQCSRLSPYLAWGNISIHDVYCATKQRALTVPEDFSNDRSQASQFQQSLRSFSSRLSWHCHFIQKLESEPEIEERNICRIYDGMRENEFDDERFAAWKEGLTGFPMIDACMRYLHIHRWINFRMRAMLMSFAAYHLWLHWREPALFLARHFLDFEPGIHFPQCQMQSGVTGINTIRIYSPKKQLQDQDPTGQFVRQYVPELRNVPIEYLAEPFRMSLDLQVRTGCQIGIDYPRPIVDESKAVKFAKDRIYAIRNSEASRSAAVSVYLKHGSRKGKFRDPLPGKTKNRRNLNNPPTQGLLPGFEDS